LETRARTDLDGVVDLQELNLRYIEATGSGIRIGAMASLTDLCQDPATMDIAGNILPRTAHFEGPINLRNAATVGGAVATAAADSELFAALLCLDAAVLWQDEAGEHRLPLAEFNLTAGAIITALLIPDGHQNAFSGYARVARSPVDRPIVAAIACVTASARRIALCGVGERPLLQNGPLQPAGDFKGSRAYRLAMAELLAQRALAEADAAATAG
jgi:CO/xanthine dehydrogenase FAD-binding subunit